MYNSIYPAYINTYQGLNNNRRITKKEDDEKSSQSSQHAENDINQGKKQNINQPFQVPNVFPNGEKVAIDYSKKQIGINQVLSDFRNTANAIGAPDDVKNEVFAYLSLIENQAQKNNPNANIIQANLKNASQILDDYITKTLNKPSKVVENWVEALFLQQIDYKMPAETVSQPEETLQIQETVIQPEPKQEKQIVNHVEYSKPQEIYIPENPELKRIFIQAKKYAAIDDKEKALYYFQTAMDTADEIGDKEAKAMIHYEEGRLYDGFKNAEDALYNYHRAAKESINNNIKARAHYSMGKIYDDYVKFEPAVQHLSAAVSFAGEADNLKLQSQALSNLARIHTQRYDKQNAYMFMDMSDVIANETKNSKIKGNILFKNARYCTKLGDNAKALEYYKNSAGEYNSSNDKENLAKNYKEAAEIMIGYGNIAKARKLLSKAFISLQGTDNLELKQEVVTALSQL